MKAQEMYSNTNTYRGVIADRFLAACQLTHDNIELAQQRQKTQYDKITKERSYDIGQQVWLYTPTNKKGLSSKLTHNWHGPYCILATRSPVHYLLDANNEHTYCQTVHGNQLKPFISAANRPILAPTVSTSDEDTDTTAEDSEEDPAEVAVKSILDKNVFKIQRCETFYLIEWENKDLEPSSEPLANSHCGELLNDFESTVQSMTNC